jgi:hypothetical protein
MDIVSGSMSPDHVHLLISVPLNQAFSKIVQYIKGKSSRKLMQEFEMLKKRYWGQHLWARGYYAVTVGNVNSEDIQKYIEDQEMHHKMEDFRISERLSKRGKIGRILMLLSVACSMLYVANASFAVVSVGDFSTHEATFDSETHKYAVTKRVICYIVSMRLNILQKRLDLLEICMRMFSLDKRILPLDLSHLSHL